MAMTNVDIGNFRELFDRTDKDKVREHLTMNRYNAEQAALAHQWLHDLEEERATRDREEELDISREANRIAHNANHMVYGGDRHRAARAHRSGIRVHSPVRGQGSS